MAAGDTGLERSLARVGLAERLLSGTFRGCCLVMRAAARCCGVGSEDEASGPQHAVDFHALALFGSAPLGEIAAAQRELVVCQNALPAAGEPPLEALMLLSHGRA